VAVRGFIVQPTYRIEAGRPVVQLFGRLEDGASFLVRDRRVTPYFFVRAADAAEAQRLGAPATAPAGLRAMDGGPVSRIEVATPAALPPLRDALQARGLPTYEADVRFAFRFLIDRGLRGALSIEGEPSAPDAAHPPVDRVFDDPELAPADRAPDASILRVVSIDLETDFRGERIFSAALAGAGGERVLLALPEPEARRRWGSAALPPDVEACGDEGELLRWLFARLRETDFDILTGWNVIDFDLAVLAAAARRRGVPFEIGRAPGSVRVVRDTSFRGHSRAAIPGRLVLDGIDLLKGSFVHLEDYRLETAGRALLGEGKVVLQTEGPAGRGRAAAIERAFRDDLPRFVDYNATDARLVLQILRATGVLELSVRRSLLTGMPLDRVGSSIASFDFLYLGELRRRGMVAPSVRSDAGEGAPTAGGAVLEPAPGLYDRVLVFDFKSLYPSLIRTFNIDPLGYVPAPTPEERADLVCAPNGARFRRAPGILPGLLDDLAPRRDAAKRRHDAIESQALKILMNSFYGVLATPACRFHNAAVANAITLFGQWVLHWARDRVETQGHRVLYGDTDSLFVLAGAGGREETRRLGEALCARINDELGAEIRRLHRVESRLELQFEGLFLKFFLPAMRHGGTGARKRYAGLRVGPRPAGRDEGELVFVGMEVVRRDWTELSKIFQRGLFERLFRGEGAEQAAAFLRAFVADLRAGRHDGHLLYRKALRKPLRDYTATTPPHVQAARKMATPPGGVVEYLMTTAGPEPAAAPHAPPDYDHYIERQIRPIAEQVLPLLGLSFERALGAGADGQMPLF
jgi:DNA polymerase II